LKPGSFHIFIIFFTPGSYHRLDFIRNHFHPKIIRINANNTDQEPIKYFPIYFTCLYPFFLFPSPLKLLTAI
jgi:hypothetical protein